MSNIFHKKILTLLHIKVYVSYITHVFHFRHSACMISEYCMSLLCQQFDRIGGNEHATVMRVWITAMVDKVSRGEILLKYKPPSE